MFHIEFRMTSQIGRNISYQFAPIISPRYYVLSSFYSTLPLFIPLPSLPPQTYTIAMTVKL